VTARQVAPLRGEEWGGGRRLAGQDGQTGLLALQGKKGKVMEDVVTVYGLHHKANICTQSNQ